MLWRNDLGFSDHQPSNAIAKRHGLSKSPNRTSEKVLSRLIGGRENASDATNYTSMGLAQLLALGESPCVEN